MTTMSFNIFLLFLFSHFRRIISMSVVGCSHSMQSESSSSSSTIYLYLAVPPADEIMLIVIFYSKWQTTHIVFNLLLPSSPSLIPISHIMYNNGSHRASAQQVNSTDHALVYAVGEYCINCAMCVCVWVGRTATENRNITPFPCTNTHIHPDPGKLINRKFDKKPVCAICASYSLKRRAKITKRPVVTNKPTYILSHIIETSHEIFFVSFVHSFIRIILWLFTRTGRVCRARAFFFFSFRFFFSILRSLLLAAGIRWICTRVYVITTLAAEEFRT